MMQRRTRNQNNGRNATCASARVVEHSDDQDASIFSHCRRVGRDYPRGSMGAYVKYRRDHVLQRIRMEDRLLDPAMESRGEGIPIELEVKRSE